MKFFNKFLTITIILLLTVSAGCSSQNSESSSNDKKSKTKKTTEVTVFAASSLTEALNQISKIYTSEKAKNIKFTFNYGSSGDLQTQIENGAEADIFIAAAKKQMDALEKGKFINDSSRKDLLGNKVVLILPKNSKKNITSFEDCLTDKAKLIAVGNADVPVGQYTEQIFKSLKGWDIIKKKASFGSSVKEVLSQVEKGSVDCGVVYATDAATSKDVKIVAEAPTHTHEPVVYPEAVIKGSSKSVEAQKFLDFLETDKAKAVFNKIGFTMKQ